MINNVNILAVDDEADQLTAIQNAFFTGGVPCLPIHYQYNLLSNKSGIDHVDIDNYNPRVIVTDLNLRNGSLGNPMELVTPIANLLEKLKVQGPYILIFWSGVTEHVERVMELLQERFCDKIAMPIHYSCIDKNHYLNNTDRTVLKNKVRELINESELLTALLDWESRINKAAQSTTDALFNITKPGEVCSFEDYQKKHKTEMQLVLAKIANETVGELNAKDEPEIALDLGLAPVLQDKLSYISNENDNSIWKNAAPKIGESVTIDDKLSTKLNSFYHIEKVDQDYSKACRGTFIEIQKTLLDDKDKRKKLETRLGMPIEKIISEEFLSQIINKANIENFVKSTRLGFIEISAVCDQAQKKTKLHRYTLAALTPLVNGDYSVYGKYNKKSHNGIYRVPDINIDGKDYMLQLSFKYQIGSLPTGNIWFGNSKLRLRDQIMTEISFSCAQYISRPGLVLFK